MVLIEKCGSHVFPTRSSYFKDLIFKSTIYGVTY